MENLVYFEDARLAVSVGYIARLGVLLYGPGGHAKSRGVDDIMDNWRDGGGVCTKQVLSIGTNPLDLVGGGSPQHFKEYIFDRPRVEDSWYAQSDVHCFEEFLDLPPRVAAYLKDLITARVFRYQNETVPMRCRLIIGCTNHDPAEVAKQDPSVAALLERFPLQVEVVWPHYTAKDFAEMFASLDGSRTNKKKEYSTLGWDAISALKPLKLRKSAVFALTEYLGRAVALGAIVSPRTAVYCATIMGAYAALNGDAEVGVAHLNILRLITGLRNVHKDVMAALKGLMLDAEQSELLDKAEEVLATASKRPGLEAQKALRVTKARLGKVQWTDTMADRAKIVRKAVDDATTVSSVSIPEVVVQA